jgi:hypothetical protein
LEVVVILPPALIVDKKNTHVSRFEGFVEKRMELASAAKQNLDSTPDFCRKS